MTTKHRREEEWDLAEPRRQEDRRAPYRSEEGASNRQPDRRPAEGRESALSDRLVEATEAIREEIGYFDDEIKRIEEVRDSKLDNLRREIEQVKDRSERNIAEIKEQKRQMRQELHKALQDMEENLGIRANGNGSGGQQAKPKVGSKTGKKGKKKKKTAPPTATVREEEGGEERLTNEEVISSYLSRVKEATLPELKQLFEDNDRPTSSLNVILSRMAEKGLVRRPGRGVYAQGRRAVASSNN